MKKGFTLVEIIATAVIIVIIGLISFIMVKGVIKNIKKSNDKEIIDNYVNNILYVRELYIKNNDNNVPKYCYNDGKNVFYDENFNNKYDSNELVCKKDCEDDNCIKYFITNEDIKDKKNKVKCNKIILEDKIEISDCYIDKRKVNNYKYAKSLN